MAHSTQGNDFDPEKKWILRQDSGNRNKKTREEITLGDGTNGTYALFWAGPKTQLLAGTQKGGRYIRKCIFRELARLDGFPWAYAPGKAGGLTLKPVGNSRDQDDSGDSDTSGDEEVEDATSNERVGADETGGM